MHFPCQAIQDRQTFIFHTKSTTEQKKRISINMVNLIDLIRSFILINYNSCTGFLATVHTKDN